MARQIGLKNVYFAKLIQDDSTGLLYSTPRIYERAVSATITPKTNSENLYSDDTTEDVLSNFDSVEVEIELAQLQTNTRAFLQGSKTAKGMLIENGNDLAPYVAMGFMSKKSNNAYKFVWLVKGQFQIVTDTFETIADKAKAQTSKLKATFIKRTNDDNWRFQADNDYNATACANWFDAVPVSVTPDSVTTITATNSNIVTSVTGTVITASKTATVAQLMASLSVDGGLGTVDVFTTSNKTLYATNSTVVNANMVVVATAEDGVTQASYTVALAS